MKGKFIFPLVGLLSVCLFPAVNLQAKESLDDGVLWLTKSEVNEKFGKPTYLYCEEEPYRRYEIVKPENENALRATFLYDVVIHDFYYIKRDGNNVEYRIYYGEDVSGAGKTYRAKKYSITFMDGPVQLGKIAQIIPEFKPAYESKKVFHEHLINFNTIRLIFVTDKVNDISKRMGSLFTDTDKDIKDWSLSYEVMLCAGEPENVSANSMVKKVVVSVDGEYRIGKTAQAFGSKLIKNPLQ